jgi:hypothetical protein
LGIALPLRNSALDTVQTLLLRRIVGHQPTQGIERRLDRLLRRSSWFENVRIARKKIASQPVLLIDQQHLQPIRLGQHLIGMVDPRRRTL